MKKLLLLLLTFPSIGFCDTKISALTSTTTLNAGDIFPVVTNPSTTPANRVITKSNLLSTLGVIQNQETLQTGATFYVSSGTVNTSFVTNGTVVMKTPITINQPATGSVTSAVSLTNNSGGQSSSFGQRYYSGTGFNVPFFIGNTLNDGSFTHYGQLWVDPDYGTTVIAGTNSVRAFSVGGTLGSTPYNFVISTTGVILIGGSAGTSGQALTSSGSGSAPSWTTISGGSGGYAVAPATVPFNLAQGVTGTTFTFTGPAQSTVTYGLTVGSFTVNGSSAGQFQLTEGLDGGVFAPASGKDNFWASSSSHAFVANFNGSASSYTFVGSSITPVAGQFPIWIANGPNSWVVGSSVPAGSGGGGSTSPGAPVNSVQYNSASAFAGSNNFQFNGSSISVTFSSFTMNDAISGSPTDNDNVGRFNLFVGTGTYSGLPLMSVGSQSSKDQLSVLDGLYTQVKKIHTLGLNISVASDDKITSINTANNFIDFYNGQGITGEMALQTGAVQTRDIVFLPQQVETIHISSNTMRVISSMTVQGSIMLSSSVYLSGSAGTAGQILTSGGVGAVPTWTTAAGGGDMALASTQTVTGGKTFASSTTFTGAVVVSSTVLLSNSPGTSGQVLTTGGGGALPTWTTPISAIVTSSSMTFVKSSFSFTTNGSQNSTTPPGVFDIYDSNAYSGKPIFTVGTQNLNNQFVVKDQTALTLSYGIAVQNLQLGFPATPDRIGSNQTSNNWIDIYNGQGVTGEMALQTGAAVTRDIVIIPEQVETVHMSSNSTVFKSSVSIIAPSTDQFVFRVSTSATAGIYSLAFSTNSHISTGGVTPSTSSCGTGGGIVGTDTAGTVTGGTGSTGCTLTFAQPFKNDPVCVISEQTGSVVNALSYTHSTTQLVVTQTGLGTGKFDYHCIGLKE